MDSHKKLIVPVIALLLCAVSIVGVGFAYSGQYVDTANDKPVDSFALMVDADKAVTYGDDNVTVYFDTLKTGVNGTRGYVFSDENASPIEVNTEDNTKATYTMTIEVTVKASEMAASGTLVCKCDVDTASVPAGFATVGTTPAIAENNGAFTLAANESATFTVTITINLDSSVVTDANVNGIMMPKFTFTATAATAQPSS